MQTTTIAPGQEIKPETTLERLHPTYSNTYALKNEVAKNLAVMYSRAHAKWMAAKTARMSAIAKKDYDTLAWACAFVERERDESLEKIRRYGCLLHVGTAIGGAA